MQRTNERQNARQKPFSFAMPPFPAAWYMNLNNSSSPDGERFTLTNERDKNATTMALGRYYEASPLLRRSGGEWGLGNSSPIVESQIGLPLQLTALLALITATSINSVTAGPNSSFASLKKLGGIWKI